MINKIALVRFSSVEKRPDSCETFSLFPPWWHSLSYSFGSPCNQSRCYLFLLQNIESKKENTDRGWEERKPVPRWINDSRWLASPRLSAPPGFAFSELFVVSYIHKKPFQFDLDHDGYIPTNELKKAIRESTFSFGLDTEEIEKMTEDIDRNHDHLIDFSEFCILVSFLHIVLKTIKIVRYYKSDLFFKMSRAKRYHLKHIIFRAAQFVVPKSKRTESFGYLQRFLTPNV